MITVIKNVLGVNKEDIENPEKPINKKPKKRESSSKKLKFMNSGAYGCVFSPGINCSTKQLTTKKYITKIQNRRETSLNETVLGKIIKEIPESSRYFAPILENCSVDISDINDETELKKCKILDRNVKLREQKYETNRIQYVGKYTLMEYLKNETTKIDKASSYLSKLINSHVTILHGIEKLNNANLIHFDIKENNIMCRDKSGHPVLIDFGMSINIENMDTEKNPLSKTFFASGIEYSPWCIEICLIHRLIANRDKAGWRDEKPNVVDIKEVSAEYIKKNQGILDLLTEEQRGEYKITIDKYISNIVDGGLFNIPNSGTVYDELTKNIKSWDNYSAAVMYLSILKILNLYEYRSSIDYFDKYINELILIIMSPPDTRPMASITLKEFMEKLKETSRKDKNKSSILLNKNFSDADNLKARNENIASAKTASQKEDNKMLEAKGSV